MASNNENGNLMDEFEEAFQACILSLTKQEPNTGTNKEEIELEVQKTTNRFIDVARQMEAFFLQKRFLVSSLKPDMLIKDENTDLRIEIQRKEALLNKHYNRLEEWKAVLSDMQAAPHLRPPGGTEAQQLGGLIGSVGSGAMMNPNIGTAPLMNTNVGGVPLPVGAQPTQTQQQQQMQLQTHIQQQQQQQHQQKLMQQQMQQLRMMGKYPPGGLK